MENRNLRRMGGLGIAARYTVPVTIFYLYQEEDIVVNEFMYRPPETHPRFIELYNRSERLLNLKGWRLQRRAGAGEADRMVSESDLVIEPERDRKSTRLNSSHVAISYAVFCLKKKRT